MGNLLGYIVWRNKKLCLGSVIWIKASNLLIDFGQLKESLLLGKSYLIRIMQIFSPLDSRTCFFVNTWLDEYGFPVSPLCHWRCPLFSHKKVLIEEASNGKCRACHGRDMALSLSQGSIILMLHANVLERVW